MFLDCVAALDLLEHNESTNILKEFPLIIRRAVSSQILTFLLEQNPSNFPIILKTVSHVRLVLELIGQAFRLPIEDFTTIINGIEIYRRWLLEPTSRPPVMEEELITFFEIMLQQLSLVFEYRATQNSKEGLTRHSEICKSVFGIYLEFFRSYCNIFSSDLMETILKLLLGITNNLLHPPPYSDPLLGKKMASIALKVIHEAFIRSQTKNSILWGCFRSLMQKWTPFVETVQTWNHSTLQIATTLLQLLYPNPEQPVSENHKCVVILKMNDDDKVTIGLDNNYLFYLWERMLYCCGNINDISDPSIFQLAMQGTNRLANIFLSYVKTSEKGPSGNAILKIFGNWLFEAITYNRQGYEQGTSIAVETLIHIISETYYCDPLDETFLASFYHCMIKAYQTKGIVLVAALQHTHKLLPLELPRHKIIIPYINATIASVYIRPDSNYDYSPTVRATVINIFTHLISLPNHFHTLPFVGQYPQPQHEHIPPISFFRDLEPSFGQFLVSALSHESDCTNLQRLLHASVLFICEFLPASDSIATAHNISNHSSVPQHAYYAVWSIMKICISKLSLWSKDVVLTSLDTLSSFVLFFQNIGDSHSFANTLVQGLCTFLKALLETSNDEEQDDDLIIQAFHTLTDWLLAGNWLFEYPRTINDCLHIYTHALGSSSSGIIGQPLSRETAPPKQKLLQLPSETTIKQRRISKSEKNIPRQTNMLPAEPLSPFSHSVVSVAQSSLATLLSLATNFPVSPGGANVSSLLTEADFADPATVHYFSLGGSDSAILSVINNPFIPTNDEISTIFILRSQTGKHVWQGDLSYFPKHFKYINDNDLEFIETTPKIRYRSDPITSTPFVSERFKQSILLCNEEKDFGGLFAVLDERQPVETLCAELEAIVAAETEHLETNKHGLSVRVDAKPSSRKNTPTAQWMGRILLNQLGFLSHPGRENLSPLDYLSGELLNRLKHLDATSARTALCVGVLYIRRGGPFFGDNMQNVSSPFASFCESLGWTTSLTNPADPFFSGGLSKDGSNGKVGVYWANYSTEVIFHCAPYIDNMSRQAKQMLFANDNVVIVWAEGGIKSSNYRKLHKKLSPGGFCLIIISPLISGLYQVNIVTRDNSIPGSIGPICEQVILGPQSFGPMIRESAILWSKAIRSHISGASSPYVERAIAINSIRSRFKKQEYFANMYVNFFKPQHQQNTTITGIPLRTRATNVSTRPPSIKTTPVPPKRDSTTSTPVPPKRDSTTSTPVPPKRDSTTSTPVPPKRDSTTSTPVPPKRDSTTSTPVPPERDSTTSTPVPPKRDLPKSTPVPPKRAPPKRAPTAHPIPSKPPPPMCIETNNSQETPTASNFKPGIMPIKRDRSFNK